MTGMTEKTKKFWVLMLASIASCMVVLDAVVVTTALGAIRAGLEASLESLEWTVNAYHLSFAESGYAAWWTTRFPNRRNSDDSWQDREGNDVTRLVMSPVLSSSALVDGAWMRRADGRSKRLVVQAVDPAAEQACFSLDERRVAEAIGE